MYNRRSGSTTLVLAQYTMFSGYATQPEKQAKSWWAVSDDNVKDYGG